ncbi:DUF2460 domain-containing protein [Nereida sp. MMG025]|uniref:DUF2460 domain-containing protein n=1 Tax=Nereida sp. MMG025 TaxID=2909981 RepID=UPI001F28CE5C|nr:DUF2460 domain-containing protein [Nereida sp. MMG025]MCF6443482.1 DUF2460 domain-containing protein [Nereida sp. MMG025]
MGFHDVRFPTALSFGSMGGPERRTDIVTLANGHEERNTPWAHSRRRYDAGIGLRSLDDVETLVAFFEARRGPLHGFRWKDWSDWRSARASRTITPEDQVIAKGDGMQTVFQLQKQYISGAFSYERPVTKPVAGTVIVALDREPQVLDVDFTVDAGTGKLTFAVPPEVDVQITAGFEFDVPVRFDVDRIQTSVATFQAGEVPDVPVVEVRV